MAITEISDSNFIGDDRSFLNDTSRSGKLEKVSDNSFEVAQTGTEYYSPDQHGGTYGTVYRQYFSGTSATLSLSAWPSTTTTELFTVTGAVELIGVEIAFNTGTSRHVAGYNVSGTSWINQPFLGGTNALKVNYGSTFDAKAYTGWVDYTK